MGVLSRTFQILSVVVLLIAILIGGYIYDRKYLPHDANFQGSPELSYPMQLFCWGINTFFTETLRIDNVEQLMEEAKAKTGLDDFDWERDPNAFHGLQLMVNDVKYLQSQKAFTGFGLLSTREGIRDALMTRLRVIDALKRHAHELKPVQEPLIIVGLPRTGTTFLLNLLSQDPQFRLLRFYEAREPARSVQVEKGEAPDERLSRAESVLKVMQFLYPPFISAHNTEADGPEECVVLFTSAFQALLPTLFYGSPTYSTWYFNQTFPGLYAYYHEQLQLLQLENPNARWLLKSPIHLHDIESLFREIPSTKVVWTHRTPNRSAASMASLTSHARSLFLNDVNMKGPADYAELLTVHYLNSSTLARENYPDMSIVDVAYNNLVADPLQTVAQIYQAHDIEFTQEAKENMRNFLHQNPQHKLGKHIYEQFSRPLEVLQEKCPLYFDKYAQYFD